MNVYDTNSSLLPTKFSELPHLHNFVTSFLFSALVVLALHPSIIINYLRHCRYILNNFYNRKWHFWRHFLGCCSSSYIWCLL